MPTLTTSTTRQGSHTSAASATIDQPSAQITANPWSVPPTPKSQPNASTTVSSSKTSQSPRVQRNREISLVVRPRRPYRYAAVPARKTNEGAQKCVIHRVKNSQPSVCARSSGAKCCDWSWK